jgi:signal peptidase I
MGPASGWIKAYLDPIEPHTSRGSWWFAWAVFAAFAFAVWLTSWPLNGWAGDFGLYFVHPIVWLTVALLSGYGWLRLEDGPAMKPTLIGVAFWTGVVHVIVLIVGGIIGSFVDSPFVDGLIEYPLNLFYIITVLAAAETSRAFLFTVWRRDDRTTAFVVISLTFAIAALTATELTPFDSVDEFLEVAGQRWLPVLSISVLATALVDIGGLGPSFAYRLAVLGFMWVWPSLPDLHWVPAAVIGIATPWFTWRVINAVYMRTEEGEETLKGATRPRWGVLSAVFGLIVMVAVIVAGLLLIFGTGITGYRIQLIEDTAMEPEYERGNVVLIEEDVNPESLQVDDVIRIMDGDDTPIRRIVAIDENEDGLLFTVQGDNLPDTEEVAEEGLAGTVVLNMPAVGDVVIWWRE